MDRSPFLRVASVLRHSFLVGQGWLGRGRHEGRATTSAQRPVLQPSMCAFPRHLQHRYQPKLDAGSWPRLPAHIATSGEHIKSFEGAGGRKARPLSIPSPLHPSQPSPVLSPGHTSQRGPSALAPACGFCPSVLHRRRQRRAGIGEPGPQRAPSTGNLGRLLGVGASSLFLRRGRGTC
jgi:hypothetical protein